MPAKKENVSSAENVPQTTQAKELDVFATTRIGINLPFVKPGKHWAPDYFQFGQSFGANWFFSDTIGINLEFGYPFSKFGVALKF